MVTDLPFIEFYLFFIGACIGSFLNVCIYRIPENLSIVTPGSHCPNCKEKIPFYYNLPIIGYIILKGRCRFCKTDISIRYLLIELLTGIFFLLLYYKFGFTLQYLFWTIFISVLITISFIDIDHQIIPDILSLPGIFIFASSFYFIPEMTLKDAAIGILAGGGILYAVALGYYFLKKIEGMGGGDIKLLAMIGAATGINGVLFTIFAGSLLGAVAGGTIMVSTRIMNSKLKIPFGPFLSLGAVLYIFYGPELIRWYISLLGK